MFRSLSLDMLADLSGLLIIVRPRTIHFKDSRGAAKFVQILTGQCIGCPIDAVGYRKQLAAPSALLHYRDA